MLRPGALGDKYRNYSASWSEQHSYVAAAIDALQFGGSGRSDSSSPAALKLHAAILNATAEAAVRATMPPAGYTQIPLTRAVGSIGDGHCSIKLQLSPAAVTGVTCAGSSSQNDAAATDATAVGGGSGGGAMLLQYHYHSLNESDMSAFRNNYSTTNARAYGKTNMTADTCADKQMGCAVSRDFATEINALYVSPDRRASLLMRLAVVDSAAHEYYGAPAEIWIEVAPTVVTAPAPAPATAQSTATATATAAFVGATRQQVKLLIDVQVANKTATRIPEFQSLQLAFPSRSVTAVTVDKLGSQIDASDVTEGGAGHLHGVGRSGVAIHFGGDRQQQQPNAVAVPLDSSLVSVGRGGAATAFPTPLTKLNVPELQEGVHFILHDNIWDTNYPVFYPWLNGTELDSPMLDGNDRYRFEISF